MDIRHFQEVYLRKFPISFRYILLSLAVSVIINGTALCALRSIRTQLFFSRHNNILTVSITNIISDKRRKIEQNRENKNSAQKTAVRKNTEQHLKSAKKTVKIESPKNMIKEKIVYMQKVKHLNKNSQTRQKQAVSIKPVAKTGAFEDRKSNAKAKLRNKNSVNRSVKLSEHNKLIQTNYTASAIRTIKNIHFKHYANNIPVTMKKTGQNMRTGRGSIYGANHDSINNIISISQYHYKNLYDWIASHKYYPMEALYKNEYGDVVLSFTIDNSGVVSLVKISHRSDYDSLNRAAVKIIKRSSPIPKDVLDINKITLPVTGLLKITFKIQ